MAQSRFSAFLKRVKLLISGQSTKERRIELSHQFYAEAAPAGRLGHQFGIGVDTTATLTHSINVAGIDLVSGLYHTFEIDSIDTTSRITHQYNVNELTKEKILAHTFTVPLTGSGTLTHQFTGGIAASSGLNQEFNVESITVASGLHQEFNLSQIDKTKILANTFGVSQETTSGLSHSLGVQQTTSSGLAHEFNTISITTSTSIAHEFNIDYLDKTSILSHLFGMQTDDESILAHRFGVDSLPQTSGLNQQFNIYGILASSGLTQEVNVSQIDGHSSTLTHQFGIEFTVSGQIFHQFTLAYTVSGELTQEFNIDSIATTATLAHSFEMNVATSRLPHEFSAIGVAQTTATLTQQFNVDYVLPSNRLQHQFRLNFTLPLPDPIIHSGDFKFLYDDSTASGTDCLIHFAHSGIRGYSYSDPIHNLPLTSGTWYGINSAINIKPSLNSAGTDIGHRLQSLSDLDDLDNLELVGTTYDVRSINSSPGLQQFNLNLPPNSQVDLSRRSNMQIVLKNPSDVLVSLTLRDDSPNEAFTSGGNNQAIVNFRTGIITLGFDIGDDPGDGFRDVYPPWTNTLRNQEDIDTITALVASYNSGGTLDFTTAVGPISGGQRGRPDANSTVHAFYYSYEIEADVETIIPTKASGLVEADYLLGTFLFHNDTLVYSSGVFVSWPEYLSDTTYLRQNWTSPVITSGDNSWRNIDDFPIRIGPATLLPGDNPFGAFFGRQITRSGDLQYLIDFPTIIDPIDLEYGFDPFAFSNYTITGQHKFPLEREFMISGIYVSQTNGAPGSALRRGNTIARLGFTYSEQSYQPEELSWRLGVNTPPDTFASGVFTDQWLASGMYRDFTVESLHPGDTIRGRIRAYSPNRNTTFSGVYPQELLDMSSEDLVNLWGGGAIIWPDVFDAESVLDILYVVSGLNRGRIPAMITLKSEDINQQPKVLRLARQGVNTLEVEVLEVPVDASDGDTFGTLRVVTNLTVPISPTEELSPQAFTLYKEEGKNAIPKIIFADEMGD